VTTAKGLGNGVPIGACLARGEAAELFVPGNHGSTFGGNPLACAAAHAVLDVIEEEDICTQAHTKGLRIVEALQTQLAGNNSVKEVRGLGMMIAVELNQDVPDLVSDALHSGLLINVTQGNIVRLLPPLNMSNQEADELVSKLTTLLNR
jgi:acetylornithine aminotransferase